MEINELENLCLEKDNFHIFIIFNKIKKELKNRFLTKLRSGKWCNFCIIAPSIKNNGAMIQKFKQKLSKAVKVFYHFQFEKIQEILESIDQNLLDKAQISELLKFQKLFFLGQLLGLSTLHALLEIHGIKSNQTQKNIIFYVNP